MPIDYSLYPKDWKTRIRPDILKRADNKCEKCGVANYAVGYWDCNDKFWTGGECLDKLEDSGYDVFSEGNELGHISGDQKPIKIVLTISHTDHDINNNDYGNLKALCQRHHLEHDRGLHQETRNKKKGLQKLF